MSPPGLFAIDAVQGVRQEEEERHHGPGPARHGLLLAQGRRPEAVVVEREQAEVSDAAEEADQGEQVGRHPAGTHLHHLWQKEMLEVQLTLNCSFLLT